MLSLQNITILKRMFKSSVPLKVTIGYVIIIAIFGIAVWMVYGNTRAFMRITEAERKSIERRDLTDRLVYNLLELSNKERAICLGRVDELDDFSRMTDRLLNLSDSLSTRVGDSIQAVKIDSLKALLRLNRDNTRLIAKEITANGEDKFYRDKVERLHEGHDSVVIHPKTTDTKERQETVYEVVKTRRNFFARLADAFRKQRTDTVRVQSISSNSVSDSAKHSIDIADTVADLLAGIKREEARMKQAQQANLSIRENEQQAVGMLVTDKIEQLLKDIRRKEHDDMQKAFRKDYAARQSVIGKVIILAAISVLSGLVLLILVKRDVRRDRRHREDLEEANDETRRVMAQRERLLLTITHDIKAPAASISGFIELLKEHVSDRKGQTYVYNIGSSATHLLDLVTSLLDYHRLEDGKVELRKSTFNPSHLIGMCATSLRPQADKKGLELNISTDPSTDKLCLGDAFRIRQVLENIIGNALKYTSEGYIHVSANMKDLTLNVDVADTGCGMTPEECHKAFAAFTRLPGSQGTEGVGLGLSITKEFVNLLGGRLTVESQKGKGTTFHIAIPLEQSTESEVGEHDDVPEAQSCHICGRRNVLILDDDKLQLQLLKEMINNLTGRLWHIVTTQHATEAFNIIGCHRPDFIFVDVEMPEMSGMDVARQIGSQEGVTLIAMTAHDRSIEPQLHDAGFDKCLFKPYDAAHLASVISDSSDDNIKVETCQASVSDDRFAGLTAFAAGDEDAERAILDSFAQELASHAERLKRAESTLNRKEISAVAHKAMPTMQAINATCVPVLRLLSPENIMSIPDSGVRHGCEVILEDMAEIASTLSERTEKNSNQNNNHLTTIHYGKDNRSFEALHSAAWTNRRNHHTLRTQRIAHSRHEDDAAQ